MLKRSLGTAIVLISLAAFLSSCGGGGGITSPSPPQTPRPPPPPPPVGPNEPPTIIFSMSTDTPNEGDTFLIDARASYDPEGEIRSIIAVHNFNEYFPESEAIQVNVGSHPEGVFEFLVPEVFGDTQAIFEITAEDDRGASSSARAYPTFRSTVNTPKTDGFGGPYRVFHTGRPLQLLGEDIYDVLAVEVGAFTSLGGQEIIAVGDEDGMIRRNVLGSDSTVAGEVRSADTLVPYALKFNLQPVTPYEFVVISEDGNGVHWFADYDATYPENFELKQTIDIVRPCYLGPRVGTGQDFVWIGQRGAGLSVVQIDRLVPSDLPPGTPNSHWARGFDYSIRSRAGGSRSLCYVYPTVLSERLSNHFPQSTLSDLIAVDYDSNELVLFADDAGNDETYEVVDVIALDTGGAQNLKIIDVRGVGSPSLFPNFLLVLMSDGVHNGQHRLVIVEQEPFTNEISQSVYSWQGGAPKQMITPGNLFGTEGKSIDYGIDMVIISSTSSQAVILEDERADLELGFGPPVYKPPQYLEIGSGAGSAIPMVATFGNSSRAAVLVSYPGLNELKLWVYRD